MLLKFKAYWLSCNKESLKLAIPKPNHPAAELDLSSTALLNVILASYQLLRFRYVKASLK